jgi:Ca-activated chloride channel family protein
MKITKSLCIITAILVAVIYGNSITGATGSIKGKVTDENGHGIPGTAVRIEGTTMGAAASFDGSYVILNVPAGTYTLVASSIGYSKMTIDSVVVVADSMTEINFQLTPAAIKTGDVVVTAQKEQIREYETSIDMRISGSDTKPPKTNAGDALRTTTGFVDKNEMFHARGGRGGEISHMADGVKRKRCLVGHDSGHRSIHYPPFNIKHNTEAYDRIYENEFLEALSNPLSTFSIDVDAASYSNTRRFLNDGYLPPPDAVRIEEFINYFSYEYPQPDDGMPFSITTEVSECPWESKHRLLHIGLQGKNVPMESIPPGNLVFLLDVSGSMNHPAKLPLLKKAFKLLVNKLRDKDRVAIVVYASASGLVLPSTPGSQKGMIINAIENLYPGGSTAGAAGIQLAYEVAGRNFIKGGNNRVILATDGDFNVGVSSDAELVSIIEEKREQGTFLTVLGFGTGNLKDSKMEKLADKGNGNYAYIDNLMEARKVLVNELGGTLFTIAKDVKIQLEFNPARVLAYRLIGYENRMLEKEDFNDDKKDAGEIGSGHTVTAIYEIIPAGADIRIADVDPLKYQRSRIDPDAYESAELLTVKFRYKKPDGDKSRLITVPVLDQEMRLAKTSDNFRFSAAVAEFGMLLRDSKFKGDADYDQVIELASGARGEDSEGYRVEFIRLVELSKELSKSVAER